MLITDAGTVVAALVDHGDGGDEARSRLARDEVGAPELVDLETLSALRRLRRSGRITAKQADQAVADLRDLPILRASHAPLLPRCWELRETVTAYDAAYVALAEALGAPLVTTDARLAGAPGPRCRFELITLP